MYSYHSRCSTLSFCDQVGNGPINHSFLSALILWCLLESFPPSIVEVTTYLVDPVEEAIEVDGPPMAANRLKDTNIG